MFSLARTDGDQRKGKRSIAEKSLLRYLSAFRWIHPMIRAVINPNQVVSFPLGSAV